MDITVIHINIVELEKGYLVEDCVKRNINHYKPASKYPGWLLNSNHLKIFLKVHRIIIASPYKDEIEGSYDSGKQLSSRGKGKMEGKRGKGSPKLQK